jgi:DNA-binding CsgD family transcriptional regulator
MRPATDRLIAKAPVLRQPDEVLDMLQHVSLRHPQPLVVACAWDLRLYNTDGYEGQLTRDVFYHPDFPTAVHVEHRARIARDGTLPQLSIAIKNISNPATMTELMQTLQLTGEERWPFDLYRKFGYRDCLYCTFRHWGVQFAARQPLQLERGARFQLAQAASVAAERLEQLVAKRRRTASSIPKLSAREKLVLLMAATGRTREETAEELHVGLETVRTYIRRILRKLGARNIAHAVYIASQAGIL